MFMSKSHLAHTNTGTGNDATRLKNKTLMTALQGQNMPVYFTM